MKLRIFILLSLLFHFALLWMLRPQAFPVQDLTQIEVVENLSTAKVAQRAAPKAKVVSSTTYKKTASEPESVSEETKTLSDSPAAVSQTTSTAAAASNSMEAVSVGSVTDAPKVLKEKKIEYPLSARRAGIEGVVELKLIIDREGKVQEAQLVRGPGYGLDEAALGAIKEFIFSPALMGNEKVPVRIIYKYRFKLGGT